MITQKQRAACYSKITNFSESMHDISGSTSIHNDIFRASQGQLVLNNIPLDQTSSIIYLLQTAIIIAVFGKANAKT